MLHFTIRNKKLKKLFKPLFLTFLAKYFFPGKNDIYSEQSFLVPPPPANKFFKKSLVNNPNMKQHLYNIDLVGGSRTLKTRVKDALKNLLLGNVSLI
jgi:hypothetical protein